MATTEINGITINVNEEGYFLDPTQWSKDIAIEMAKRENIELSDKHFQILEFLRNRFLNGETLTIRSIGKSGIVDIKQFYELFPGGPLKMSSKIAGIPKPASCV
jgi:dissimilatory sulfite reductase related protein